MTTLSKRLKALLIDVWIEDVELCKAMANAIQALECAEELCKSSPECLTAVLSGDKEEGYHWHKLLDVLRLEKKDLIKCRQQ